MTVAAAQTLPEDAAQRATLILVAFVVAADTLLRQAGTLPWLIKSVGVAADDPVEVEAERAGLLAAMHQAGMAVLDDPGLRRPTGEVYDEDLDE